MDAAPVPDPVARYDDFVERQAVSQSFLLSICNHHRMNDEQTEWKGWIEYENNNLSLIFHSIDWCVPDAAVCIVCLLSISHSLILAIFCTLRRILEATGEENEFSFRRNAMIL